MCCSENGRVRFHPTVKRDQSPKLRLRNPTPLKALHPGLQKPRRKKIQTVQGPQGQRYVISPPRWPGYQAGFDQLPGLNGAYMYGVGTAQPFDNAQHKVAPSSSAMKTKSNISKREQSNDMVPSQEKSNINEIESKMSKEGKPAHGGSSLKSSQSHKHNSVPHLHRSHPSIPKVSSYKFQHLSPGRQEESDSESEPGLDFDQMEAGIADKLISKILNDRNFEKKLFKKAKVGKSGTSIKSHIEPKEGTGGTGTDINSAYKTVENPDYLMRPRFLNNKDLHPTLQPCTDPPCKQQVFATVFTYQENLLLVAQERWWFNTSNQIQN